MMVSNIYLKEVSLDIKDHILDFAKEARDNKNSKYPIIITKITEDNIDEMLLKFNNSSKDIGLQDDQVPSTWFFIFYGEIVVGTINIRHRLNQKLFEFGGHVGYFVKEDFRNKGIATKSLSLCLEKAKELDIDSLLLMCRKDNTASRRVIEKNGGIADGDFINEITKELVTRFWIEL